MEEFILHIESTGKFCSVALSKGEKLIGFVKSTEEHSHVSKLPVLIDEMLNEYNVLPADLVAIAVCIGPGSYTGIRVGVSMAKTMAFTLDISLIAISGLEAIADYSRKNTQADYYISMVDARRMEVYAAVYDQELKEVRQPFPYILDEMDLPIQNGSILFCGEVHKSRKLNLPVGSKEVSLSALNLIELGVQKYKQKSFEELLTAKPLYIKLPNITQKKKSIF